MLRKSPFEYKMIQPSFRLIFTISLTLLIFVGANVGSLLGIPGPLPLSLVWPPTGFSMAALLLFGFRAWPGIFLGNLVYNIFRLYLNSNTLFGPMFIGLIVSLGSLFQALLGWLIIQRFSSKDYFANVKDIFIFLFPAGLLTCMVASTIGVAALYIYQEMSWEVQFYSWVTFWLGDSLGVYVFTPLIVVWALDQPLIKIKEYRWEALGMLAAFLLISYMTFILSLPLWHIFIPLSIWITYRFRMHGATLAIFLITLTSIIFTSFEQGFFVINHGSNPLLMLVTLIEIIVAVSLILAAVINERETAWRILKGHNIDLQRAVELYYSTDAKELQKDIFQKEKSASLDILTLSIAKRIEGPLKMINKINEAGSACLSRFENSFHRSKDKLEPDLARIFQNNIDILKNCIHNISKYEGQANRIAKVIHEQSFLSASSRTQIKYISINTLLNMCLSSLINEIKKLYPGFTFITQKKFAEFLEMIPLLPEDLGYALNLVFINAIHSMKEKKDKMDGIYTPELTIITIDRANDIEIVIRDNGVGIPAHKMKNIIQSFINVNPEDENADLADDTAAINLSLAYDIIVHIHQGTMRLEYEEGDFFEVIITLPKAPHEYANLQISEEIHLRKDLPDGQGD